MKQPIVGLLGLYLEFYDSVLPSLRIKQDEFYQLIAKELEKSGLNVLTHPTCRIESEFKSAVKLFEEQSADAIITLHLAYSPSLESAKVLAESPLPLIILDTTPTFSFGFNQMADEILYNHGIHGVQDLCNLLLRYKKPFKICAGHWKESDVIKQVAGWSRAAAMVQTFRNSRVGRIGKPFTGMGDFQLDDDKYSALCGLEIISIDPAGLADYLPEPNSPEALAEIALDKEAFICQDGYDKEHADTARTELALRRWLNKINAGSFTMNFNAFDKASGMPTVPFIAASKAMTRGVGYAGEGDVLTAALTGALLSVYPETSFTEMFCPDWEGGRIFLSHMGEINLNLTDGKANLICKPLPWIDVGSPMLAVGRFKAGEAVLVNIAPAANDEFRLILAPVTMEAPIGDDKMGDTIRGWFKPKMELKRFLERYSENGGTHHCALVYDCAVSELVCFAEMARWEPCVLGES